MLQSQNKFIIYLHIQKTGGITLQRILRRKLGSPLALRLFSSIQSKRQTLTLEEALRSKQLSDRYCAGHFCFGVHRLLPQPFTYITILREPVSRIISLYHYSQTNPTAYYHKHAINKSLEEFALKTPLMELDNGQVRFLAGDEESYFINRTPVGECRRELLEAAQKNMEKYFSFIGITEYFDQSILLLSKKMRWRSSLFLRRNSTNRKKSYQAQIPETLRQEIAHKNSLDIQLYEHAKKIFFRDLQKLNLDSSQYIQDFQKRNQLFNSVFGPPYEAYHHLKGRLKGQIDAP